MSCLQRFRVRHNDRNAIWICTVVAMFGAIVSAWLLHSIKSAMSLEARITPDAERAVLGTMAGAMFTFVVFV
jgi:hypothetical protein